MNATATTTQTHAERASAFTAQVREHLRDLPADELDDLLDGLGADLEERLADGDELGDPGQYADELRQAAGLPVRVDVPEAKRRRSFAESLHSAKATVSAWFAATPGRAGFRDFMLSLRPLWWIIRAIVLVWAVLRVFNHPVINGVPFSFPALLLGVAAIVVSVQWGRDKWLPANWLKHVRTVASGVAVLLVLPIAATFANALLSPPYVAEEYSSPSYLPGLYSNEEQVTNIFAYDCAGELLDGIRLYDQNGNPLTTTLIDPYADGEQLAPDAWDEQTGESLVMNFNPLAADSEEWNVYPLTESKYSEYTGEPGTPKVVTPHRASIAPLVQQCPTQDDDAQADSAASDSTAGGDASADDAKPQE